MLSAAAPWRLRTGHPGRTGQPPTGAAVRIPGSVLRYDRRFGRLRLPGTGLRTATIAEAGTDRPAPDPALSGGAGAGETGRTVTRALGAGLAIAMTTGTGAPGSLGTGTGGTATEVAQYTGPAGTVTGMYTIFPAGMIGVIP